MGKRIFTGLQPRRLGRLIAGLAGSWTAAGEARLAAEARRFTLVRSELMLIRLDDQAPAEASLGALADEENQNATLAAIGQVFPALRGWVRQAAVPFSSARKWSAASFAGHGTWVLGAPEMVLPEGQQEYLSQAATLAATGRRVLLLAQAAGPLDSESLPQGRCLWRVLALVPVPGPIGYRVMPAIRPADALSDASATVPEQVTMWLPMVPRCQCAARPQQTWPHQGSGRVSIM